MFSVCSTSHESKDCEHLGFFFFFWPCLEAYRILVPRPGIEPVPSEVEMWSSDHWIAKEFPCEFPIHARWSINACQMKDTNTYEFFKI